jgi:hypothetical protein
LEVWGDSLRWTPPAAGDTLITLLLRAETPQGLSATDTVKVWRRLAPAPRPHLELALSGGDVFLSWSTVPVALGYRLESSADPSFPPGETETLWTGEEEQTVHVGGLAGLRRFYRVVALLPGR